MISKRNFLSTPSMDNIWPANQRPWYIFTDRVTKFKPDMIHCIQGLQKIIKKSTKLFEVIYIKIEKVKILRSKTVFEIS